MSNAEIQNRRGTWLLREDILQQMRGLSIVKVKIGLIAKALPPEECAAFSPERVLEKTKAA